MEIILKNIKTYNQVLSLIEVTHLRSEILNTPMFWRGNDGLKDPINTLTKYFDKDDKIFVRLQNVLTTLEPRINLHTLQRSGINLTMPQLDPPYFHTDGPDTITCLFYLNPKFDQNQGGETQFDFDNHIIGIKPEPGRLIIFDGNISHRGTYFRNQTRITVFLKYIKHPKINLFE